MRNSCFSFWFPTHFSPKTTYLIKPQTYFNKSHITNISTKYSYFKDIPYIPVNLDHSLILTTIDYLCNDYWEISTTLLSCRWWFYRKWATSKPHWAIKLTKVLSYSNPSPHSPQRIFNFKFVCIKSEIKKLALDSGSSVLHKNGPPWAHKNLIYEKVPQITQNLRYIFFTSFRKEFSLIL